MKTERITSGFVSILGRPNAGKSTLLNALIGTKLAIVSSKPQTTRQAIQGVMNREDAQVVFLDTPGIHEGSLLIHKRMMNAVREALSERDLMLYVSDATQGFGPEDEKSLQVLARVTAPVFLVLNKIDQVRSKQTLLPLIEQFRKAMPFAECFPVSALKGDGLALLREAIVDALPEGPRYFPPDHLTDQPERHLAAEFIREQVLEETRQEVPHAVAVLVEEWEEKAKVTRIGASIVVERDGQKRILIGAGGSVLKKVGSAARLEIERLLGRRVHLELFVKVRSKWRESGEFLNELDWR